MDQITVQELKAKLDNGKEVFVLDVREPFEQYQSKIQHDHTILIPLGELPERISELEEYKDSEVVCLCRSGSRSARACELLENEGFSNAKNLEGGINQWAREIDTSLPVY